MGPRVLVSNDDGIGAPGLLSLVKALAAAGLATCVSAPDGERSATGHGISVHGALYASPMDVPGAVSSPASPAKQHC